MAQIDALLSQMQQAGIPAATLRGGAPMEFAGSSTKPVTQGKSLPNVRLNEILREILPVSAQPAFESGESVQFDYASPLGNCHVVARQTQGVIEMQIAFVFSVVPNAVSLDKPAAASTAPAPTPTGTGTATVTPTPSAYPASVVPPTSVPSPVPVPVPVNNSGQKDAVLPPEIRGFNWGGLFLSWIWAIGNSTWIGLLGLIPCIGFIMRLVLGIGGNQMAWRARRWDSVAHFQKTQKTWGIVGAVIFLGSNLFMIPLLGAILFPVFARARENARRTSCQSNMVSVMLATLQYQKANGKFPTGTTMAAWKTALLPYANDEKLFLCPSARGGEESYTLNPRMSGINPETLNDPAGTPVFFDSDTRHLEGLNVAFADGHIKFYRQNSLPPGLQQSASQ
jgi:prepilin-type processing-associated H-X9-DG protein